MKPTALTLLTLLLSLSLACSTSQAVQEIIVTPSAVSPTSSLSASPSPTQLPVKTICAEHLNFRKLPGPQSPIFAVLHKGQQVSLTGQSETTPDGAVWVKAQTADETGWLNVNYLCER